MVIQWRLASMYWFSSKCRRPYIGPKREGHLLISTKTFMQALTMVCLLFLRDTEARAYVKKERAQTKKIKKNIARRSRRNTQDTSWLTISQCVSKMLCMATEGKIKRGHTEVNRNRNLGIVTTTTSCLLLMLSAQRRFVSQHRGPAKKHPSTFTVER